MPPHPQFQIDMLRRLKGSDDREAWMAKTVTLPFAPQVGMKLSGGTGTPWEIEVSRVEYMLDEGAFVIEPEWHVSTSKTLADLMEEYDDLETWDVTFR